MDRLQQIGAFGGPQGAGGSRALQLSGGSVDGLGLDLSVGLKKRGITMGIATGLLHDAAARRDRAANIMSK